MADKYELSWKEIPMGFVFDKPMASRENLTGSWRSERPVWDHSKCIKCGVCYMYCPEGCIHETEEGYFQADYDYCKGCGICVQECWTQCIKFVPEES